MIFSVTETIRGIGILWLDFIQGMNDDIEIQLLRTVKVTVASESCIAEDADGPPVARY